MQAKLEKLEKSFQGLYLALGKVIEGNEVQAELNTYMHNTYKELKKTVSNCYVLVNNIEERLYKIEKAIRDHDTINLTSKSITD